jgi:hypothetical protein
MNDDPEIYENLRESKNSNSLIHKNCILYILHNDETIKFNTKKPKQIKKPKLDKRLSVAEELSVFPKLINSGQK